MSILWCGGEDIDFLESFPSFTTTSGTYIRTDYSRIGYYCSGAGKYIKTRTFSPASSLWVSFRLRPGTWSATNRRFFGLTKSGTLAWVGFGVGSVAGVPALIKHDGVSLSVVAEGDTAVPAQIVKVDLHIENYGSPSATITGYIDGVQFATYTGDISVLGQSALDQIHWLSESTSASGYVSEMIVADEDTRLMSLKTLAPDSAGDASEWTNGYANIDEVTNSDADTVYTETAGQNFQCNLTGRPAGDYISKGIKISARMTDGVGGMGVKMGIKTNSTLDLSDPITLPASWATYERLYQQNPVTSNRFSAAEAEALQVAFQSVAV